jgi:hypothetical protein
VPPVLACGPSFQATYECEVHFEHCYALDETIASGPMKEQCWHEWLAGYTFGQPRDRVDFASMRIKTLSAPPPTDPPDTDASAPTANRAVVSPMPTSAFVSPPTVAAVEVAASAAAMSGADRSRIPGGECARACEQRWTSCRDGCVDGACAPCDRAYRSCMPACFPADGHSSRVRRVE